MSILHHRIIICLHTVTSLWVCTTAETDKSEAPEQAKKLDQSDTDEALYLPPLPPDQLDTVVKVVLSTCMCPPTHSVHISIVCTSVSSN